MRPMLRERQNACEAAGQVSEDTNAQFIKAGFYRILQPRVFGGYEFDLPTFLKVMIAVSRGCSDSGWVLALTAGHAFLMSSFPEAGQREAFGDSGEFRAPSVAMPGGLAAPVPGGYRVKGAWDYTSGCDLATHFIGSCMIQNPHATVPDLGAFIVFARDQYRIVDNWHVIGMQGTSSRRVVIEEIFVPDHRVLLVYDDKGNYVHPRPGSLMHANPLYRGRITSLLVSEVCAVAVGIGRGALDLYDEILRIKKTSFAPFHARVDRDRISAPLWRSSIARGHGRSRVAAHGRGFHRARAARCRRGSSLHRRGRPQTPADRAASHQALLGSR